MTTIPEYLKIEAAALGKDQPVRVRVLGDMASIAADMAQAIAATVRAKPAATLIIPVGPVDQFPVLARLVNEEWLSLRDVVLINMDEYLTDGDRWLPLDHPLSFRAFMNRKFYDLLAPELAPPPAQRVFPDPADVEALGKVIDARGGVDVAFGGIGINGHLAFNEPPEPGETVSVADFGARPTRVLGLARETRAINAVTVGGELSIVPRRCVTVGMREILAARQLRFYCNRPWQAGVVRRALHGPLTPDCPASYLRTHPDAELVIAEYVAARPEVGLR
jgi:glucosamine-6-phosphate deaminase